MPDGKYITLKEAAELSGYAPDYIGQLIRQGKLPGKQVYYNVAWVTTEAAVHEYLDKGNGNAPAKLFGQVSVKLGSVKQRMAQRFKADKAFKIILYAVILVSILAFLYLFYVVSISINEKLGQRAIDRVEEQALIESQKDLPVYESL